LAIPNGCYENVDRGVKVGIVIDELRFFTASAFSLRPFTHRVTL
jgi:hypothetical protein